MRGPLFRMSHTLPISALLLMAALLTGGCRESDSQSIFRDGVASTEPAPPPPPAPEPAPATSPDLADLPPAEPTERAVEQVVRENVYTYVEQMPEFPGGMAALASFVQKQIHYPAEALRNEVEGKVFVRFVVETDGAVREAEVVKGIGAGCDEEALRVVQALPRFRPGKQNGRTVPVFLTVPLAFTLSK